MQKLPILEVKTIFAIRELRQEIQKARRLGKKIHFVPTMGALHAGHLRLIEEAKKARGFVVVSIFVNPLQFGPREDFLKYPRMPRKDAKLLRNAGVDLLFSPQTREMFCATASVFVREERVSHLWCGAYRPGHFQGVLTIVAKLFHIVDPDAAYFGQKDYQQWFLIQKMARELNFPCRIVRVATVRDRDGLALSSRNAYLSSSQRRNALFLVEALRAARRCVADGERRSDVLKREMRKKLREFSGVKIQYIGFASQATLEGVSKIRSRDVILLAAWVGKTRLIDNWIVGEPL